MASQSSHRAASRRPQVVVALALTLTALSAPGDAVAAGQVGHIVRGHLRGVVPPRGQVSKLAPSSGQAAAGTSGLVYHNGPVMHTNKTYAMYWKPANHPSDFVPGFTTLVDRYFADVAADSGQRTSVYSSDVQYYDNSSGHIRHSSTFGGSFTDTSNFTSATCLAKPRSACLTDSQIRAWLNSLVDANSNLPRGLGTVYFVFLPPGIVVCDTTAANSACSSQSGGFCAYHGDFGSGASSTLYAVHPNPDPVGCNSGDHPNGNADADNQINLISHEHNEAITDPLLNPGAWYDAGGEENGDLCAWDFGSATGTAGSRSNQLINGHGYWLQQEWSNYDSGCVQRFADKPPTATFSASPNPVSPGQQVSFNVNAGVTDPDSDVIGYSWNFGDGTSGSGASVQHSYSSGGSFTATLSVIDNDGVNPTSATLMTVTAHATAAPPTTDGPTSTGSTGSPSASGTSLTSLPPLPTVAFLSTQPSITVSRKGAFSYSFTGTPAGASGRVSFGTAKAIAAVRRRKLSLGSSSFSARGSGRTTVTIKLSRANFAILKRKRSISVKATVTIGAVTKTATFTLKAPRR